MAQVNVKNVSDSDSLGDSNISNNSSGTCSKLVKYGVIAHDNLKQDLMEWNHLHVADRMHKSMLSVMHYDKVGVRAGSIRKIS
jgi:hypothetical protein